MTTRINSELHNFWGAALIFLTVIMTLSLNVHSKSYTTEDSVVLEGDPLQLPGPSIFDYHEPTGATKVKRGNDQQRYYELAGDEIYVFEPSSMGVQPFMDALFPQQEHTQPQRLYHREKMRQQENKVHIKRPYYIRQHNFGVLKKDIIPVTPDDAVIVPKISSSSSSNPSESNYCLSSNEKEGQCVPFRVCYPVVFNMIDGQLRNPGLAKILYQASGACDKNDTLMISEQSDAAEIPTDYYNQTVCCPGFFFYESNSIPYESSDNEESKTLKPSHRDPMSITPPSLPSYYSARESKLNTPADSDYYYIEEFDDETFTTTDIPKLIPNVRNNYTEESTSSSTHAESIRSEVKVESKSESQIKDNGNLQENQTLLIQNHNIDNIKSQGPVPVIVPPPHLSAWNCPGREIGMPRGHWPWMVALLNEGTHFCSGSLIDHRYILTSATCMASFQGKNLGQLRVILGDRVLYSSIDGPHVWRKVVRITRHKQYNSKTMEHDIALLEMDNPVSYSPNIQPINLPASTNRPTTKGIVSGWSGPDIGKRFFSARASTDVVVELINNNDCRRTFDGFLSEEMPDTIICTKTSNASCMADPGGPLMIKTGNCWHVIGILSQGLGCNSFPEMYTDISHTAHILWVQKNIRHHFQVLKNVRPLKV